MAKSTTLETVTFSYFSDPTSLPKDVSIEYAHSDTGAHVPIDTLVFCGLGNEGEAAVVAAERLHDMDVESTVVVAALPYWEAKPDNAGIINLAVQGSQALAAHMRERHGATVLHGVGESQAGPGLLEASLEDPDALDGRLGFLRPLGFNHLSTLRFMARMARTGLQREQLADFGTSSMVGGNAGKRVVEDWRRGGDQLRFALGYKAVTAFASLLEQGRDAELFATERDLVFTPGEYVRIFREHGEPCAAKEIQIIDGSHSSPATRGGAKQVGQVVNWCQTGVLPGSAVRS